MTTPLPNWTLEEVETTLLRLVRGTDAVMVRHLAQHLRETLPDLSRQEALLELLALVAGALSSATHRPPLQGSAQDGSRLMT